MVLLPRAPQDNTTTDNVISDPDIEMPTIVETTPPVKIDDPYLVEFDRPFDSDNPKDWSKTLKWTVTDALSATGFNRIMVSTIMAPAIPTIAAELHMSSIESFMALSIYVLATAIGPVLISPLCEIYGRKPILHVSNIWFLVFNIVCGFAKTKQTLIAARFLAGFGASAIFSLAAAVLGDMWRPEERGITLAVYSLIPLLGSAVGPIIGGIMAERTTWRWMFWSTSAFQGLMVFLSFVAFKETHAPTVLRRRAQKLRRDTGESRYQTAYERLQADKLVLASMWLSLSRPIRLLATHPIIQIVALFQAFNYGVLYIVLSSFATLWTEHYDQRIGTSGLHYIAVALGEIVGSQLAGRLMNRIFAHLKAKAGLDEDESAPEWHLPLMLPATLVMISGLLIYGWSAAAHVHWIVVDIGAFLYAFGGQIIGQPMQAYIIDAYPAYVSSATAATRFITSMCAFAFPLFTPAMYAALGYGWGNTVIALAALVLLVPAPLGSWKYGPRIRARAIMTF